MFTSKYILPIYISVPEAITATWTWVSGFGRSPLLIMNEPLLSTRSPPIHPTIRFPILAYFKVLKDIFCGSAIEVILVTCIGSKFSLVIRFPLYSHSCSFIMYSYISAFPV